MRISSSKIIYADSCYKLNGIFYKVHNELGRFCKEKQYADAIESLFKKYNIIYQRELDVPVKIEQNNITKNRVDFLVDNKILVEIKAKKFIERQDYYQTKRYLESIKLKLGLIVNFHERFLRPKRIINSLAKE
ncbi:MAG: GxxExxY protein [Patescibacteria group bacterium]